MKKKEESVEPHQDLKEHYWLVLGRQYCRRVALAGRRGRHAGGEEGCALRVKRSALQGGVEEEGHSTPDAQWKTVGRV